MRANEAKAREICKLYHDGATIKELTIKYNCKHPSIINYLKGWYPKIYFKDYPKRRRQNNVTRYKMLGERFEQFYIPGAFTLQQVCRKLKCNSLEFESMKIECGFKHVVLKSTKKEKEMYAAVCSLPQHVMDFYKLYTNYYGMSMRELVQTSVNEFIIANSKKRVLKKIYKD